TNWRSFGGAFFMPDISLFRQRDERLSVTPGEGWRVRKAEIERREANGRLQDRIGCQTGVV
ncbi:hypothetical protein ACYTTR_19675, partial [Cobetia marina]